MEYKDDGIHIYNNAPDIWQADVFSARLFSL